MDSGPFVRPERLPQPPHRMAGDLTEIDMWTTLTTTGEWKHDFQFWLVFAILHAWRFSETDFTALLRKDLDIDGPVRLSTNVAVWAK